MNYNIFIYIFFAFLSAYGVSAINFDGFIRKNHIWEARVLALLIIFALGYLAARFVIDFVNLTYIG